MSSKLPSDKEIAALVMQTPRKMQERVLKMAKAGKAKQDYLDRKEAAKE